MKYVNEWDKNDWASVIYDNKWHPRVIIEVC